MPSLKETIEKIRTLFSRKKSKALPSSIDVKPDLLLKSSLDAGNMAYYENPNNYNDYCKNYFADPRNFEKQYDYVSLITRMQKEGVMQEFEDNLSFVEQNSDLYYSSEIHGISHTSRVVLFAQILSALDNLSEREKNMVIAAAQFHDIGREDDDKNFDHGLASVNKIKQKRLLDSFEPRDRAIIEFAIEHHSLDEKGVKEKIQALPRKDREEYRKIINYLQDSDKLDRTRIANYGEGLDPNRLATDSAKKLVKFAHQNYFEFRRMNDYIKKSNQKDVNGVTIKDYFYFFRSHGYNITFKDFANIITELEPDVLEKLALQGKLLELFSYETFEKYSTQDDFESSIDARGLNPDTIYKEMTEIEQTKLMRETFDSCFMLLYNLKKNDYSAYTLLCKTDVDLPLKYLVGVAHEINPIDIDRFASLGYDFRLNDIFLLASKVEPEVYRSIIDSGNLGDLLNTKYEKEPERVEDLWNRFLEKGIRLDRSDYEKNYRLYQQLGPTLLSKVLEIPGAEKYSISDIFSTYTKLNDARYRMLNGKRSDFDFDAKTLIDLLEYSKKTQVLDTVYDEQTKLDIVGTFVKNRSLVQDPRYISYFLKKNLPYRTKDYNQIINYKEYCADRILADKKISLQDAKSRLIRAVFRINCSNLDCSDFEKEAVETLYYYRKYFGEKVKQGSEELYDDTKNEDVMARIEEILASTSIADFKKKLEESKKIINRYNTEEIGNVMKNHIFEHSKSSIVEGLKRTESQISLSPTLLVKAENGESVPAKVLSGEKFFIATSTILPKCSSTAHKIRKESASPDEELLKHLRNTKIRTNGICTTVSSEQVLAHAASALENHELLFGYVPEDEGAISLLAMHDLYTTGKNRKTDKVTTPREIGDFVNGTLEEHNEAVINNVRPRYIVCYDHISDLAIMKQKEIQETYDAEGKGDTIEILFIDGKNKYLPNIINNVHKEHEYALAHLTEGNFNFNIFEDMFEKHEGNITLRTLQAIHSSCYRADVWNNDTSKELLDSLINVLEKVAETVPASKSRAVLNQVNLLLERADDSRECFGRRYYDRVYRDLIDTERLKEIRETLEDKNIPYEELKTRAQKKAEEKTEDLPTV